MSGGRMSVRVLGWTCPDSPSPPFLDSPPPTPVPHHPTQSNFFDSFAFDAQRGEWVATEAASASHRAVCMKSHHHTPSFVESFIK